VWAGVDSVWEQEKLEARKILENAAESHTSGARFVSRMICLHYAFDRSANKQHQKEKHGLQQLLSVCFCFFRDALSYCAV
jgi:hypothetical protein